MIELAHLLPGGRALVDGKGVSDTYVGMIETAASRKPAYVKFVPPRELANELLGSVLASAIGLRTPKPYIVLAQRADYPSARGFEDATIVSTIAFATEQVGHLSLARRVDLQSMEAKRSLVAAWKEWPDVIAFDDWIANGDRHAGNYLVGAPGEVWLIDHGHSFTGPNWQVSHLAPSVVVAHRLWLELLCTCVAADAKAASVNTVQKAVQKLSELELDLVFSIAKAAEQFGATDSAALKRFLSSRVASVASRIGNTLGIPLLPFEV